MRRGQLAPGLARTLQLLGRHQVAYDRPIMNLFDLEAFASVVETGSVVAASARLHLSQSAITRRIQNVESELNIPLLHRDARPLQPTKAGLEIYEHARRVLSSMNDLRSAFAEGAELSGEFRFGITRELGDLTLTYPIDRLQSEYPRLKLQAIAEWSNELLKRVHLRQIDVAVALLPEESVLPEHVTGEVITTDPILVIASKKMSFKRNCTLKDLSVHPWIVNPPGCGGRELLRGTLSGSRLPFKIGVEAYGVELKLALVAKGLGLGLVHPKILPTSPFRKQVRVISVSDFRPRLSTWVLHPPQVGRLSGPISSLRETLKRRLLKRNPRASSKA
jgi:DNA-binding transcriptional LysR family regulator